MVLAGGVRSIGRRLRHALKVKAQQSTSPVRVAPQSSAPRQRWYVQANPDSVPSQAKAKTEPKGKYTSPMHPEIRQTGPGSCPKYGMALEPATVTAPAQSSGRMGITSYQMMAALALGKFVTLQGWSKLLKNRYSWLAGSGCETPIF